MWPSACNQSSKRSDRSIRTESQLKSQSQGMERSFNSYQVDPFGCRTHPAPDALHTCSGRRRCSPAERLARYAPMLQRSCDQGRAIIVTPSASTQRLRQRSVSHRVIRVSHLVYWRMRHNQSQSEELAIRYQSEVHQRGQSEVKSEAIKGDETHNQRFIRGTWRPSEVTRLTISGARTGANST